MMKRCVAASCSNTYKDGVSLSKFPKDKKLRLQWKNKLREQEQNGKDPVNILTSAAAISLRTALKFLHLLQVLVNKIRIVD